MASRCSAIQACSKRLFLKPTAAYIHNATKRQILLSSHAKWSHTFRSTAGSILGCQSIYSNTSIAKICSLRNRTMSNTIPNTDTILDTALQGQQPGSLSAEQVYQVFQRLEKLFYETISYLPWIQRNPSIGFIQLLMSDNLETLPRPIWTHPLMEDLIKNTLGECHNMNPQQLTCSFMSLMHLGVMHSPYMERIVPKLQILCHERVHTFGLESLSVMLGIRCRMFQRDWIGMQKELNRLSELLADHESHREWTPDMTSVIANIIICCSSLPLANLEEHIIKPETILLKRIETGAYVQNPDTICLFLRLARKLNFIHKEDPEILLKIVNLCSEACLTHIDSFDTHNIAIACASLRKTQYANKELMTVFCDRGLSLLNEECSLSDVSNLFYSVNQNTSLDIKRLYESAIYQRLNGDVDSVILSNLSENMVIVNVKNTDLLILLQEHIAKQADKLTAYTTRFSKIVHFLIRRPFLNPEHEALFTESAVAAFNRDLKLTSVALFTLYLLSSSTHPLDETFMARLLTCIPKLQLYDHHRIALGINRIRQPISSGLRTQVATIQAALFDQIVVKSVKNVPSLSYLTQVIMEIVVNNKKRDPTLATHLMEMFPSFTQELNDANIIKVIRVFNELPYYLPAVLDKLVDFVIDNPDSARDGMVTFVLSTLSKVAYTPKRIEEFYRILLGVFHRLGAADDMLNQLRLIRNLSILHIYPEKELLEIFSIDYIERLDRLIENHPLHRVQYEHLMMTLNRNVVLDCPQLDIPWFHDQHIDKFSEDEPMKHTTSKQFRDDVEETLIDVEILKKSINLRRHVRTRYGYLIHFECMLNDKNKPVSPLDFVDCPLPPDWQRLAILTLNEASYTWNTHRMLIGLEQLRWRHLEIMGYKIVEVPYFEWYSMGLSGYQAKVDYLFNKIFNS